MDGEKRERARAVEHGLRHAVQVVGRPATTMGLVDRMAHHGSPGVSVAVIHDGEIDWALGFGLLEAGRPEAVTTETRLQAGSISKPVAAMAALRLVEDGLLDLDEDVNAKLTSWRVPDNEHTARERVTLRRLLSHTAGLTVHGFPGYAPGVAVPTVPQILDGEEPANTDPVRVDMPPGSEWRYSGGGTTVMQQLVEDVTGESFPDVVRDLVLRPVGMTRSTFAQPLPEALRAVAASGHRSDGSVVPGRYHTYPEMAAAGLWTTPSDLARMVIEVSRCHAGRSSRVLSQAMTRQMLTPEAGADGLGFAVDGGLFGHGGGNDGFIADLAMYVDGSAGAAIMTNGLGGMDLIPEIRRAIAGAYDWPTRQAEERAVATVDPATYDDYVGEYRPERDSADAMRVYRREDALFVDHTDLGTSELHPEEEAAFFIAEYGSRMIFHRDAAGAVHELERTGGPFGGARWPRVG